MTFTLEQRQRVESGAHAHLDDVAQAGARDVFRRHGSVFGVELQRDHATTRCNSPRKPDGAVPTECADLEDRPRVLHASQELQQLSLIRRDGNRGQPRRGARLNGRIERGIWADEQVRDIPVDVSPLGIGHEDPLASSDAMPHHWLFIRMAARNPTSMTDSNSNPYGSKSDAELAAMEQDKSLPIDVWMEVEVERGRRARAKGGSGPAAPAAAAPRAPASSPQTEDVRVDSGLKELNGLLVPGERLLAYAVQRRLFALSHRRVIVGATSGRFIGLFRGLFGGYMPYDVRWQDLKDATIRAGIFGADLTIASLATDDFGSHEHGSSGRRTFAGLRKEQAQQVYKICQAQEQSWREKRRVRDLDELRAESGGVQFGNMPMAGGGAAPSATGDPTERLRRAKQMLDDGLITDTEYESIKARVVDAL